MGGSVGGSDDARRGMRPWTVVTLVVAIVALVVGLTNAAGMQLLAEHDIMVAASGLEPGGDLPFGAVLVLSAASFFFPPLGGAAIGVASALRVRGRGRSLLIGAVGAVATALATLVAVLVMHVIHPILLQPPGVSSRTTYENLAILTLVTTLIGVLPGWGAITIVRSIRRADRNRDRRKGTGPTPA